MDNHIWSFIIITSFILKFIGRKVIVDIHSTNKRVKYKNNDLNSPYFYEEIILKFMTLDFQIFKNYTLIIQQKCVIYLFT